MSIKFKKHFEIRDIDPIHTASISMRCEEHLGSSEIKAYVTIINKINNTVISKNGKCSFTYFGEGSNIIEAVFYLCNKIYSDDLYMNDNLTFKKSIIKSILDEYQLYTTIQSWRTE